MKIDKNGGGWGGILKKQCLGTLISLKKKDDNRSSRGEPFVW